MAQQLVIPFKVSRPVSVAPIIKEYIETQHPETHPDAFKSDISQWETLRKDAIANGVHISKTRSLLLYHAQLVFISTKLPPNCGLEITYDPIWRTAAAGPLTLQNLAFERVCVIYNLASLYSQLAQKQDVSSVAGAKHALHFLVHAAGTLDYLIDSALPQLQASHGRPLPVDFTAPFFSSLKWLMLAQAQEYGIETAVATNVKSGLLAKLTMQAAKHYQSALEAIDTALPAVSNAFPAEWKAHLTTRSLYFEALAYQKQAMDDNSANRYGQEVCRLEMAVDCAKRGYDTARRARGVAQAVKDSVKALMDTLEKELQSATRDNDLIYLKDVPAASSLPPLAVVNLAKIVVPPDLIDPGRLVGNAKGTAAPLFGDLLAHGATAAVELYKNRVSNWTKDEIFDVQKELDGEIVQKLQQLHLPAALEALDKNSGLPPSLLGKAEEIRRDGGNDRIQRMIDDRRVLAERCNATITAVLDALDVEAEEDEELRTAYATYDTWTRPPSSEGNKGFIEKALKFQGALATAAASDSKVEGNWAQYRDHIDLLQRPDNEIEAAVPSVALTDRTRNTSSGSFTQRSARALRDCLDNLKDFQDSRAEIVNRARRVAASDDIQPRIAREAAGMERWVQIAPAMFEDTIAAELQKYEQYKDELENGRTEQQKLLTGLEEANSEFLHSRKEDPAIKDREEAMYVLDQAYQRYRETVGNLSEGTQFYNQLAVISEQLLQNCQAWIAERNETVQWLRDSMNTVPSQASSPNPVAQPTASRQPTPPSQSPVASTSPVSSPARKTSIPSASNAPSTPQGTWQPRSRMVQTALAQSPSTPTRASTTPMEIDPPGTNVPAPWKETVYRPELNHADWEETPPSQPAQRYARELGNLDDDDGWEDGTAILPPPPVTPKATPKAKTSKRTPARAVESDTASPSPTKARTRSSRVPA